MVFVIDTEVTYELRPGDQGYLHGAVLFQDSSALHFREYIDASQMRENKEMYSYHYQDVSGTLIFRYDNALHRPPLPYREHKHDASGIVSATVPNLQSVLLEIATDRAWV